MLEFNKQVNASIVDPGFIARVRKKLALDQRQAAAIFGGGANAFSRYENGKTKPPLALVKLLMGICTIPIGPVWVWIDILKPGWPRGA
jgi:HTH-type transcriptional regulator/antitoxin MqsA